MGCVRCGRRQVDPGSGPSTWRRGVLGGAQVLVCPDCQVPGWNDVLDSCAECGSTALVKRLGEVSCRECGALDRVTPAVRSAPAPAPRGELAREVGDAVDRVLRRE